MLLGCAARLPEAPEECELRALPPPKRDKPFVLLELLLSRFYSFCTVRSKSWGSTCSELATVPGRTVRLVVNILCIYKFTCTNVFSVHVLDQVLKLGSSSGHSATSLVLEARYATLHAHRHQSLEGHKHWAQGLRRPPPDGFVRVQQMVAKEHRSWRWNWGIRDVRRTDRHRLVARPTLTEGNSDS